MPPPLGKAYASLAWAIYCKSVPAGIPASRSPCSLPEIRLPKFISIA